MPDCYLGHTSEHTKPDDTKIFSWAQRAHCREFHWRCQAYIPTGSKKHLPTNNVRRRKKTTGNALSNGISCCITIINHQSDRIQKVNKTFNFLQDFVLVGVGWWWQAPGKYCPWQISLSAGKQASSYQANVSQLVTTQSNPGDITSQSQCWTSYFLYFQT